jgi:hypothetical protein
LIELFLGAASAFAVALLLEAVGIAPLQRDSVTKEGRGIVNGIASDGAGIERSGETGGRNPVPLGPAPLIAEPALGTIHLPRSVSTRSSHG